MFITEHFTSGRKRALEMAPEEESSAGIKETPSADLTRLRSQISDLLDRRQELLGYLTEAHPEVVELDRRIANAKSRLTKQIAAAAVEGSKNGADKQPSGSLADSPNQTDDERKTAAAEYERLYEDWQAAERGLKLALQTELNATKRLAAIPRSGAALAEAAPQAPPAMPPAGESPLAAEKPADEAPIVEQQPIVDEKFVHRDSQPEVADQQPVPNFEPAPSAAETPNASVPVAQPTIAQPPVAQQPEVESPVAAPQMEPASPVAEVPLADPSSVRLVSPPRIAPPVNPTRPESRAQIERKSRLPAVAVPVEPSVEAPTEEPLRTEGEVIPDHEPWTPPEEPTAEPATDAAAASGDEMPASEQDSPAEENRSEGEAEGDQQPVVEQTPNEDTSEPPAGESVTETTDHGIDESEAWPALDPPAPDNSANSQAEHPSAAMTGESSAPDDAAALESPATISNPDLATQPPAANEMSALPGEGNGIQDETETRSQPLALAALVVALIVAIFAAFRLVRSSADPVFSTAEEVAIALALPVVGIVPAARSRARSGGKLTRALLLLVQVGVAGLVFVIVAYAVQDPGGMWRFCTDPLAAFQAVSQTAAVK